VLVPPFGLAGACVPDEADLVVVGNPTNPTSVLHSRKQILALRRPDRIVVVDEAFADAIPGEPASLAGESLPDVVVLRSLTKTWSLAGLRVGYALGPRDVLDRRDQRHIAADAAGDACSLTGGGGRGRARRATAGEGARRYAGRID
jgi:histidinol-phosphate aminotransferase